MLENLHPQPLLGEVVPVRNQGDHVLHGVARRSLTRLNGNTRSRRLHAFDESVCVGIATAAGNMNEQDSEANPTRNTAFDVKDCPLNPA